MQSTLRLLAAALPLLTGVLTAQVPYPVGYHDLALANTGAGSKILQVQVFYPATATGQDTPLVMRKGGWPSLVFLHGFEKYGHHYVELGYELASHGMLAFMADTAPKDLGLQIQDAIALHPALARLDQDKGSFLHGQIRADRLALLGHSTGASNVVHVLAANPGYVCGVSYGPYRGVKLDYTKKAAAQVRVPMLVIGGMGEKITPWKDHVLGLYDELTARLPFREMLLLDNDANHYNIVAWMLGTNPQDHEVFTSTQRAVLGFVRANIDGDLAALDETYGLSMRKEKRLAQILLDVRDPILMYTGVPAIGRTTDFQLTARPGPVVWMFSLRPAALTTRWGTLGLDPSYLAILGLTQMGPSHYQHLPLGVPKDPMLKGLVFWFQVAAQGRDGTRFGNPVSLPISR